MLLAQPLLFLSVRQGNDRLAQLERMIRVLEQEKALETTEGTLTSLRMFLNQPKSAFDRFEAMDPQEALVRLPCTQPHQKAKIYSAALDEVQAR